MAFLQTPQVADFRDRVVELDVYHKALKAIVNMPGRTVSALSLPSAFSPFHSLYTY